MEELYRSCNSSIDRRTAISVLKQLHRPWNSLFWSEQFSLLTIQQLYWSCNSSIGRTVALSVHATAPSAVEELYPSCNSSIGRGRALSVLQQLHRPQNSYIGLETAPSAVKQLIRKWNSSIHCPYNSYIGSSHLPPPRSSSSAAIVAALSQLRPPSKPCHFRMVQAGAVPAASIFIYST